MGKDRTAVILLGWSDPYVRACNRLGIDPVVVYWIGDANWHLPISTERAETMVFVDDIRNVGSVIAALERNNIDLSTVSGIISTTEATVITAAVLGEHFKISAVPVGTAVACRDKGIMKQRVRDAGVVPVPGWRVIEDIRRAEVASMTDLRLPVVVKPIAGASSDNARRVDSLDELASVLVELRGSGVTTFIVEEFSVGTEWNLDGVVADGVVRFLSVGFYGSNLIRVQEGSVARTTLLHPHYDRKAFDLAWPTTRHVLDALGHRDGVFHLEVFYDDRTETLTFGECGARLGAPLIPELIVRQRGVDLAEAEIRIRTGLPVTIEEHNRDDYAGMAYLPLVDGVLASAPTPADIRRQPGVVDACLVIPRGFPMSRAARNINFHAGRVIVAGDSPQQVEERMLATSDWFRDSLSVTDEPIPTTFDVAELWRAEQAGVAPTPVGGR